MKLPKYDIDKQASQLASDMGAPKLKAHYKRLCKAVEEDSKKQTFNRLNMDRLIAAGRALKLKCGPRV